ncbi:SDR family NAD(P)-dependent oxidoreductase [Pseudonocardia adelaidensis]|uniref:SDR family oxidoreductase n=1 Tax=Pseudonocardia adelaidensis TaxID=648754 RepID=A0ABP9NUI4_9PSEU
MLLEGKTAIIYGAAGHVGGAVARVFAREGAQVFLAGRTLEALAPIADEIGGSDAHTAQVDATDGSSVERHFSSVVGQAGGVDISFNLIGLEDVQGQELAGLPLEDYMRPIELGARTHFLTATAAARHMAERGHGVIMALTATPTRLALPLVGGFGAACAAIEGMLRTLAAEAGPKGVRVCWLRSAGSPESFGPDVAVDSNARPAGLGDSDYLEVLRQQTLMKRFPRLVEVAEAAVLIASDRASAMTGAAANVTCGQIVD